MRDIIRISLTGRPTDWDMLRVVDNIVDIGPGWVDVEYLHDLNTPRDEVGRAACQALREAYPGLQATMA